MKTKIIASLGLALLSFAAAARRGSRHHVDGFQADRRPRRRRARRSRSPPMRRWRIRRAARWICSPARSRSQPSTRSRNGTCAPARTASVATSTAAASSPSRSISTPPSRQSDDWNARRFPRRAERRCSRSCCAGWRRTRNSSSPAPPGPNATARTSSATCRWTARCNFAWKEGAARDRREIVLTPRK